MKEDLIRLKNQIDRNNILNQHAKIIFEGDYIKGGVIWNGDIIVGCLYKDVIKIKVPDKLYYLTIDGLLLGNDKRNKIGVIIVANRFKTNNDIREYLDMDESWR